MRKSKMDVSASPHLLRQQYAELVGAESIDTTQKQNFVLWDILAFGLIILFFGWIAWTAGYVEPRQKVENLQAQIDSASNHFDKRTRLTIALVDSLRVRVEENNITRLDAQITKIHDEVVRLSFDKPSDEAIRERFDAAREFVELSKGIVENRDLTQYYLGLSQPDDEQEPKQEKEKGMSLFSLISGDIKSPIGRTDVSDINIGGETDRMISEGAYTIRSADNYLDALTPSEERGKELLAKFSGLVMPRRKHEILSLTLAEWKGKHRELLEQWKALRKFDLAVAEIERKREAELRELELRKLELEKLEQEQERLENEANNTKAAEDAVGAVLSSLPVETPTVKEEPVEDEAKEEGTDFSTIFSSTNIEPNVVEEPAPTPKAKPVVVEQAPAPKTQKQILEEKKRKANLLLD